LKPAQANSSWDPISKNPSKKKKGLMAQGIRPGSNPITEKKKIYIVTYGSINITYINMHKDSYTN
jgi:hypothetical protein